MRILHISDFHLDHNDKNDSINHIIKPIKESLTEYQNEKPIDLILFTGDLINIGGKNYKDIELALLDCEEILINPLLEITGLTKERLYFTPGNHDIDRNADSKLIELGIEQDLISQERLNAYIQNPEGNKRIIPFKDFERYFYSDIKSVLEITNFNSTFQFTHGNLKVGIASLNSSWRCYDSDTDKGKILIGEKQVIDSLKLIEECDVKIAISHHHYEWLKDFDKEVIEVLLKQDFNLYFTGHTHKTKVEYTQDPDGKMFSFCSCGTLSNSIRNPDRKYENGFTIIDYDLEEGKLKATFLKGEYPKKTFIINSSIGKNGIWETTIPVGKEIEKIVFEQNLIKQINEEALPLINSHLLTYSTDTNAPKCIDELFVMPNLVYKEEFDAEKDDKTLTALSQIIISPNNYVLFGTKESGKTLLLDKILIDTLNTNKEHHQIPAIIDFRELKDNVSKLIKEYWGKSTEETKTILLEYKVLLLIDNISFEDEDIHKLRALKRFLDQNLNIRFIATYQQIYEEDFPINVELTSMFNFENITLKQFKTKQIKELIKKWFPDSDKYDTPRKLETLTSAFLALNLPRTPFAVSMFLWIIEKQENFKPINNSTLIENFVERLLNKHDIKESLRERFGYDNKIWIISDIAFEMLETDNINYSLTYVDFVKKVDEYLKLKKFEDFKTDKITELLLDTGIFLQENGDIRFRFTCFLEFFLVKKMENEPDFKEKVLSQDEFLEFANEIDYFTGLNRGDTKVLKLIIERLEEGFDDLDVLIKKTITDKGYKTYDDFFIQKDANGNERPSIANQLKEEKVVDFLPSNKPTEDDLEVLEDNKLELQEQEKGISRKEKGNKIKSLGKLLVLALKVIKNSEEVVEKGNPDLKIDCYSKAIDKSILFAILHKAVFEMFLVNQDKLPKHKVDEYKQMNQFLPLLHELFLFDNIGTQKLTSVIRDKINLDKTMMVSDFEKSLSVFLYADIRGRDYDKIVSEFIKDVKTKYIEDVIFFKLVTYYFYRSKDDESDNFYLNLIADLLIKSKGYDKQKKSQIMASYQNKKSEKLSIEDKTAIDN